MARRAFLSGFHSLTVELLQIQFGLWENAVQPTFVGIGISWWNECYPSVYEQITVLDDLESPASAVTVVL